MKKVFLVLALLLLSISIASAQLLVGGRSSAMGGAGVAMCRDISAAYYNPAGLMQSRATMDLKIAGYAAYSNYEKLQAALAKSSEPAQFILDNYANNLSFNGRLNGIVGISMSKIGLSVVPQLTATVSKDANSLAGDVQATGFYDPTLTLGTSYSFPFLPAALDLGINVKSISPISGAITASLDPLDPNKSSGNQDIGSGSGIGYDVGVLTSFNVPMVSKLAVGAVMRNLSASYTLKTNRRVAYIDKTTNQVTMGAETALPDQKVTLNSSTALGAYCTIPVVDLGLAADIEMTNPDTNLHFGVEYPLVLGILWLRAGMASGPNLALTTYGAEIDLQVLKLSVSSCNDAKNTGLTRASADVTIGF
jgi:hypothetical protein